MKKWQLSCFFMLCILVISGCSMWSTNPSADQTQEELTKQIMELAKKGTTLTSEDLSLESSKDEILDKLGKPDQQEANYLDYTQKGAQFLFGNNGVSKIFCYDASLKSLTLSELEKSLGKPDEDLDTDGDYLIMYEVDNIKLYFGFDMSLQGQVDNPNVNYYYIEK